MPATSPSASGEAEDARLLDERKKKLNKTPFSTFYHTAIFDARYTIYQIIFIQSLWYLLLGLTMLITNTIFGYQTVLEQFFSTKYMSFSYVQGWMTIICFLCCSVAIAYSLSIVVQRARKCLDFTFTLHLIHFIFTCFHSGFPTSLLYWLVNLATGIIMGALGEWFCMRNEIQDLVLSSVTSNV